MKIKTFSQYGDTRAQAVSSSDSGELPHGISADQYVDMEQKFASMEPKLVSAGSATRMDVLSDKGLLPKGASWTRSASQLGGTSSSIGTGGNVITSQMPYQPEFSSPDRQQYPVHRLLANRYWRLFHKMDPIIGTGIDMLADMPWSNFEISGIGVEGEIKNGFEDMCNVVKLRSLLPFFIREYLTVGEACPHMFYDESTGGWSHITLLNPDQLEIIDAPFIKMDALAEFVPDDRLRSVLTSTNPMLNPVRESLPPELVSKLIARENIPLSPVNFTHLPRKLHPYDVRGTSIISRMWRALFLEDAIFSATITTARRQASPLKVAKLGDPATGWIPGPDQQGRFLQLLAQAELDPAAWICYNYGVSFELVGVQERVMMIDRHWDTIERIKLIALGINKGFLIGETTYASAASGLTVFLQRLRAMREHFENAWIYPKFFKQVSEMNGWIMPKTAEVCGPGPYVRTRRSAQELREDNRYVVPTIEWDRSLDPSVDSEMINAMNNLSTLGIKFSKTTLMTTVNRDYETELHQMASDAKLEKEVIENNPELMSALSGSGEEGAPSMGGGGGGIMPGIPPSDMGFGDSDSEGLDLDEPPGEGEFPDLGGDEGVGASAGEGAEHTAPKGVWDADGRHGTWHRDEVHPLVTALESGDMKILANDAIWSELTDLSVSDAVDGWNQMQNWLIEKNYPAKDIVALEAILTSERVLPEHPNSEHLRRLEAEVSDNIGDSDLYTFTW